MPEHFHVYILLCADGTLYTGYTGNLSRRMKQHHAGSIPRSYTKSRRPVRLVWAGNFNSKVEARAYERKIKTWPAERKEKLISEQEAQTVYIKGELGIDD
jgi:predicted GIY-YIG superfamily endonuclease